MRPLVTIGVAVYNVDEQMLRLCLDSVVNNTEKEDEIIIVDDCSQNGSYEICRQYKQNDARITLYRTNKNSGIGYVRNLMIDKASGERIYFVDGDDILAPGAHISAQYAKNCNADVLIYDYKSFEKEVKYDGTHFENKCVQLDSANVERIAISCLTEAPCDLFGKNVSKACTSKGYKISFLKENNIRFIEDLKISEDSVFYADVLCNCKSALYFPFTLYYYRSANEYSVTNSFNPDMSLLKTKYLKYFNEKCNKYFYGRQDVRMQYIKYKIPAVIYRQFKLDIFHKDNPKSYTKRKKEFNAFLANDPYKTALDRFDVKQCKWIERALIFKLAKEKNFFALNIIFKHPCILKIYGGIMSRINAIKRRRKL